MDSYVSRIVFYVGLIHVERKRIRQTLISTYISFTYTLITDFTYNAFISRRVFLRRVHVFFFTYNNNFSRRVFSRRLPTYFNVESQIFHVESSHVECNSIST